MLTSNAFILRFILRKNLITREAKQAFAEKSKTYNLEKFLL
jgi:hypothetical protein